MKRRKIMLSVGAGLLAATMTVGLCGCELFDSVDGAQTTTTSPYDVATELGYDGSEASWLANLYGEEGSSSLRDAYAEAQKEGYTKSFLEFLKEYMTVAEDDSFGVNRALASVVTVRCGFSQKSGGYRPTTEKVTSSGAGVIYSLDKDNGNAYIITNYHVVYNVNSVGTETIAHISDEINLFLYGYAEQTQNAVKASFLGGAMEYDIAVLKVENSDVVKKSTAREFVAANSDAISVGQTAYAIGNPDGKGISATRGIVSVDAEYITMNSIDETSTVSMLEIRIDAAVNHGNSGGGLFNADGKLIGIVNARTEEEGVEAFGYAIPSNLAVAVAQNIIDNSAFGKSASRATLGITLSKADSKGVYDPETGLNYIEDTIKVESVQSGTAASSALKAGDLLYSFTLNDKETVLTRYHMVATYLFNIRKGDVVTVKLYRGGELVTAEIAFDKNSYFTTFA